MNVQGSNNQRRVGGVQGSFYLISIAIVPTPNNERWFVRVRVRVPLRCVRVPLRCGGCKTHLANLHGDNPARALRFGFGEAFAGLPDQIGRRVVVMQLGHGNTERRIGKRHVFWITALCFYFSRRERQGRQEFAHGSTAPTSLF